MRGREEKRKGKGGGEKGIKRKGEWKGFGMECEDVGERGCVEGGADGKNGE